MRLSTEGFRKKSTKINECADMDTHHGLPRSYHKKEQTWESACGKNSKERRVNQTQIRRQTCKIVNINGHLFHRNESGLAYIWTLTDKVLYDDHYLTNNEARNTENISQAGFNLNKCKL